MSENEESKIAHLEKELEDTYDGAKFEINSLYKDIDKIYQEWNESDKKHLEEMTKLLDELKRIRDALSKFPKPSITTDYSAYMEYDYEEFENTGVYPIHDKYPRYWRVPSYKEVLQWFEYSFGIVDDMLIQKAKEQHVL
jgi:hypothetical protein